MISLMNGHSDYVPQAPQT